jgi:endonuclease/exonuclease/phosphatase family metal-dependent hydrolase
MVLGNQDLLEFTGGNLDNISNEQVWKGCKKGVNLIGRAIKFIPSTSFGLMSYGVRTILDGALGIPKDENMGVVNRIAHRASRLVRGSAMALTGALITIVTSPLFLVGTKIAQVSSPELETKKAKNPSQNTTSELKLFQLNASLGHSVVGAVNHGGTAFSRLGKKEHADQIIKAIIDGESNLVTLQEVFDPDIAEYMAEKLSDKGYDVSYNCGHAVGGLAGFNSGLLTAVKRSSNITLIESRFVRYDVGNNPFNEDFYAGKGVLATKVEVDGKVMILANTHLQASGGKEVQFRQQEIDQAQDLINELADGEDCKVIFAGDMNCFDRGVSQADEWIGSERFENTEGAIFAGSLTRFSENFQGSTSSDLGELKAYLTIQGSGVTSRSLSESKKEILDAIDDKVIEEKKEIIPENQKNRFIEEFIKRHMNYKFMESTGIEGELTTENIENLLDQHIQEICKNRKLEKPNLSNLKDKLAFVLKIRDRQELISEAVMLKLYSTGEETSPEQIKEMIEEFSKKSDNDLADIIANNMINIIGENESSNGCQDNRDLAMELTLMKNVQYDYYKRNRNDRVFTKGFEGASYTMDMKNRGLSDHVPLTMKIPLGSRD